AGGKLQPRLVCLRGSKKSLNCGGCVWISTQTIISMRRRSALGRVGGREASMAEYPRLTIPFEGAPARAVRVPVDVDAREVLAALDLPPYRGMIVIHGGAGAMEPSLIDAVARFFALGLAPFAEQHRI